MFLEDLRITEHDGIVEVVQKDTGNLSFLEDCTDYDEERGMYDDTNFRRL